MLSVLLVVCLLSGIYMPVYGFSNAPKNVAIQDAKDAAWIAGHDAMLRGEFHGVVKLRNPLNITRTALRSMEGEAKIPLTLHGENLSDDGKTIMVRLSLNPSDATLPLNLYASVNSLRANNVKDMLSQRYMNPIAVITFGQDGGFGQEVEVMAKVDLEGMTSKNLRFYSYDSGTGSLTVLDITEYKVNKSGYVRFPVTHGGEIVISIGALKRSYNEST